MIDIDKLRPLYTKDLLILLVAAQNRYSALLAALGLDPATTTHADAVAVLEALRAMLDDDSA